MEKTSRPVTAGILNIITGVIGLTGAFIAFFVFFAMTVTLDIYLPVFPEFIAGVVLAVAIILLLFSLLIMVSGIFATQRKYWGLALAGSIAAVLGLFFLGIPALILVSLSKDEFD
ncbi:MAG TPA: hypothetical protein G4O16_06160 [Dehalococcoidia bacterium]|nr:hypothetical protein [Dehalococcoidia bacterium]